MSSRQIIVVVTSDAASTSGSMQRYERVAGGSWRAVGDPAAIVVGRTGLADVGAKREGDGKSPSGVLTLGTAFGFDASATTRLPYRQLRAATECVDDTSSRFYNQIVERDSVERADWKSSEKMREIDQYRWGIVVNHNTPPESGRGSCIFIHLWSGPGTSTAGCTAMAGKDLDALLRWLDPAANPRLVQMTAAEYSRWTR
ncbi:MAG: L,D-transpeptidase family protein [Thermoanaerobaculia bacterium]|nr:L,D-transpeptidase family protein [Thermoanaerobaculia bacterium]